MSAIGRRELRPNNTIEALQKNGYAIAPAIFDPLETSAIEKSLGTVPLTGAGTRNLLEHEWCRLLAGRIRKSLRIDGVAVQCTLFDKSRERNWLVALHQDLAIPVRERVEHPELRGWTVKEGQHFVQAPAALLEQLIAVRLHIDGCGLENGPLRVVPASHLRGCLDVSEAKTVRGWAGEVSHAVARGGALLLKPLTLHASSKAASPGHRRVLHFLYGPASIGYGLQWQHSV